MIDKRSIINFLFVSSFPIYGLGSYVSASKSPTAGYIFGMLPLLAILAFYTLDALYQRDMKLRLNAWYMLVSLFLFTSIASVFVSLAKRLPDLNPTLAYASAATIVVPFHAFMVVYLYNYKKMEEVARLFFISLSILLLINLVGFYGLGLVNEIHSIEGRINFPFLNGIYSGACMVCVLTLMLLTYLKKSWGDPVRFAGLFVYFVINLVILFLINSRLANLTFMMTAAMFIFNIGKTFRGLYVISIFTLPILLNGGRLLYDILSTPVFASLMQRVDLEDVITFHGRSYLWENAFDWLLYDQEGLLLGNGFNGHYFIKLVDNVAVMWGVRPENLHLHSSTLGFLLSQGLVGIVVFLLVFYRIFIYFRRRYIDKKEDGILFPAVIFLIFVMQVDSFVYLTDLGFVMFAFLAAKIVLEDPDERRTDFDVDLKT